MNKKELASWYRMPPLTSGKGCKKCGERCGNYCEHCGYQVGDRSTGKIKNTKKNL